MELDPHEHADPWSRRASNPDEMSLIVQQELSNLQALKRLSIGASGTGGQDPDLPDLEFSDPGHGPAMGSSGINNTPLSNNVSVNTAGHQPAGSAESPSSSSAMLTGRDKDLPPTPSILVRKASLTKQPSVKRERSSLSIRRQRRGSSLASNDHKPIQQLRPRSPPPPSDEPNTSAHHLASSNTPMNTTSNPEMDPGHDMENIWVPAGLHPELAPNEWQAFVNEKMAEIRNSQEAQQQSRLSRHSSRLSHVVAAPEEYVDASAILDQRKKSSSGEKRRSILELSMDFVNDDFNMSNAPKNYDYSTGLSPQSPPQKTLAKGATSIPGDVNGGGGMEKIPSSSGTTTNSNLEDDDDKPAVPGAFGAMHGATSLRRSTHRLHKPALRSRSRNKTDPAPPVAPTPPPHSIPISSGSSSGGLITTTPSTHHRPDHHGTSVAGAGRAGGGVQARVRPPLSVSIAATKALAQTAEQPPSPSAATPSPNASGMLGYRRRKLGTPGTKNNTGTAASQALHEHTNPQKLNPDISETISVSTPVPSVEHPPRASSEEAGASSTQRAKSPAASMTSSSASPFSSKYGSPIGSLPGSPSGSPTESVNSSLTDSTSDSPTESTSGSPTEEVSPTTGVEAVSEGFCGPSSVAALSSAVSHTHSLSTSTAEPIHIPSQQPSEIPQRDPNRLSVPAQSSRRSKSPNNVPAKRQSNFENFDSENGHLEPKEEDIEDTQEAPKSSDRRWRWLDSPKSKSKEKEKDEVKDTKKSFANLFKKRDIKTKESKVREVKNEKDRPTKAASAAKGTTGKARTTVGDGVVTDVATDTGVENDDSNGTAPIPPAHSTEPRRRGHARVDSRISNDASLSDGSSYIEETTPEIKLPYEIPAHQVSDRSHVMMDHRFPLHIERAIYRLSHMKLANARRPLCQQVLLSNFMYAYLNVVNKSFQEQQLAQIAEQQVQQSCSTQRQRKGQRPSQQDAQVAGYGNLEESQIEQLRQIESRSYETGMYATDNGEDQESSSSSEDEFDAVRRNEGRPLSVGSM